jgi:hypothetical protein
VRPARNAVLQTVSLAPEPKPVVVVPVHKATPTKLEVISLRQCGKCLAAKDILLLAPGGLDLAKYRELMLITGEIRVEPHWMESRPAYNRLMISPLVYEDLQGYTHMLIHEPDALVVRDELDYWCLQPYDYIGAPWFDGYNAAAIDAPILGVGNFGFSLLRLESMKKTIRSWRRWYPFDQIGRDVVKGLLGHRDRFRRGIGGLGSGGRLRGAWRLYSSHCDIFWSQLVPQIIPDFRVAPAAAALRFSWEVLPSRCFEICGGRLPFGIHAWAKYNLPFLRPLLEASGVELDLSEVPGHGADHEVGGDLCPPLFQSS